MALKIAPQAGTKGPSMVLPGAAGRKRVQAMQNSPVAGGKPQTAGAPPPTPLTYGGNNRVEGVATDTGQKLASLLTGKRKLGS